MSKSSFRPDVEIALGAGAVTAVGMEAGIISTGGLVAGAVADLAATTGMTVFAQMGAAAAGAVAGTVIAPIAGIAGVGLLLHGISKATK